MEVMITTYTIYSLDRKKCFAMDFVDTAWRNIQEITNMKDFIVCNEDQFDIVINGHSQVRIYDKLYLKIADNRKEMDEISEAEFNDYIKQFIFNEELGNLINVS